jgi:AraC-like DNA-binding protein/mannose-6-phosphate isomerase-like protein (cupin superfamily)
MPTNLGRSESRHAPDQRQNEAHRREGESWHLWLPEGLDSGVHAETPGQASGLIHVGENWTKPDLRIDAHTHLGWEVYLQVHGRSRWLVGTRTVTLAPGWAFAVPPGMRHGHDPAAGHQKRHHYAYAAFDATVVGRRQPRLAETWKRNRVQVSAGGWPLQPALRALIREISHDRPLGDLALTSALDLLLVEAARVMQAPDDVIARVPSHPATARAKDLLDGDPARPWTLDALAVAVGLSRAHLSELFAAEVGQPPYTYLLERRVEEAAHLLTATSRDVSEIAADVGFSSGSALARAFRSVHGCSPVQWRRGLSG